MLGAGSELHEVALVTSHGWVLSKGVVPATVLSNELHGHIFVFNLAAPQDLTLRSLLRDFVIVERAGRLL